MGVNLSMRIKGQPASQPTKQEKVAMKKGTKGQFSQKDVRLSPTTKKYTLEQKGKSIDQGFGLRSQKPSKNSPDHVVLQIDANDQGVLQVDCSDGEDSDQGILDWLGFSPDVGVHMVALEYLTEGDDDGISDVSDS